VILLCVRWYLAHHLSLRDLEEIMAERGFSVDHSAEVLLSTPVPPSPSSSTSSLHERWQARQPLADHDSKFATEPVHLVNRLISRRSAGLTRRDGCGTM